MYADTAAGRALAARGLAGRCPSCTAPVIPKCGAFVVHHWAHRPGAECDSWYEPMTAWHWAWQQEVPPERREVVMGPHRADIVTESGGVVEVQHSGISAEVIRAREEFYGERMAWIYDATEAARLRRITVWPPARVGAGEWDRLEWDSPRRLLGVCKRPVLLDLGTGALLYLRDFHRCRVVSRESVAAWLRDGGRWDVRRVAPAVRDERPPAAPPAGPLELARQRYRATRRPADWAAYVAMVRCASGGERHSRA